MSLCSDCGEQCSGKKCISCYKKQFNISFGEYTFESKKELDNLIKQKIKEMPRNKELVDKLLLSVINNLHEDVKKRGYTVTKLQILNWAGQTGKWEFCRERFRGGIFVIGFFDPIQEWHGVTLYPHKRNKNPKKNLIDALRQKWSENIHKRTDTSYCEICKASNPQLHHDNISFSEIAEECYHLFTQKEKTEGVGDDWWLHEQEADALPNDHPAVLKMFELHEKVKYRWLCINCHIEEHLNKEGSHGTNCETIRE